MLVLASPRTPQNHQEVPDLESDYAEMNYNLAVPLSALAARARHRAKVRTYTSVLIFQNRLKILNNPKHFNDIK